MGLDVNGTQFILYAKTLGVDFSRTAMIGRQSLNLNPSDLRNNLVKFGFSFDEMIVEQVFSQNNGYAEAFFKSLGAKEVHSFDISNYQGATHIHDVNEAVPGQFKQQYTVVMDGGSLEHVFNFPVAIKNCMEMLQVGGYYLGITPANNFMGHGFYQFSPELFFSVFTARNGYELVCLIAFEDSPKAEWYLVQNPMIVKRRVNLTNSRPTYLLIIAKRVENVEPLLASPQQSDYIAVWNSPIDDVAHNPKVRGRNLVVATVLRYTPSSIKRAAKMLLRYNWRQGRFNPMFFKLMERTDGVKSPNKIFQQMP